MPMDESEKIYRYEMRFYGQVQGVGFRYTAYHAASSEGATGWVHNEWDGTVLMQIQGQLGQISRAVKKIEDRIFTGIDRIEKTQIEVEKSEGSFVIR